MAVRYTPDELVRLRESPLVAKPPALPPVEQWMGPPADASGRTTARTADRSKNQDASILLEQASRRPQHISRNSTNPDNIILGPPKTTFMSAAPNRNPGKTFDSSDRSTLRDAENSRDRFSFRNKTGEVEDDRTRDGRNNNLLRPKRVEGDQDNEGWSTVKPRKSFGTEGAERFNGRMGVDRNRDDKRDDRRRDDGREDRRFRDRDDRDKDRSQRGFDTFSREKDGEYDQSRDTHRNGGMGRGGRGDSWFNRDSDAPAKDRTSNGDKFVDRSRGWREKDPDERGGDRGDRGDRRGDRNDRGDRRWGNREERQEREPEWMDEPPNGKGEAHTQEDFQKWKESMRKDNSGGGKLSSEEIPSTASAGGSFFGLEKPKVETPLTIDTGPDKFFGAWATPKDENGPDSGIESKKGAAKAGPTGKASRFTSFFAPQDESPRRQTDPPPSTTAPSADGLSVLFQNNSQTSSDDKVAFQQLLQKLHIQSGAAGTTPPANSQQQPKLPTPEKQRSDPIPASAPPLESFMQYRTERKEERPGAATRNSQQALQDLLVQRSIAGSQPSLRPEQMLQELVGQRQNALSQSSQRPDPSLTRNNTDFLMGLMRNAPQPQRTEEALLRMPPTQAMDRQQLQQQQQQLAVEEAMRRDDFVRERERLALQRQARQPPPGFFDDAAFQRGPQHERPIQPTQILQRPPPPGLDQMQPGWAQSPSGLGPMRQQQHIAPPPGLPGLPGRGMQLPQLPPQMFQPNFMNNFPPDGRMQPPPGFFNAPQPGFMPPGMSGFQGPEGMAFGGGPYDGRGPPPQGAFRRQ